MNDSDVPLYFIFVIVLIAVIIAEYFILKRKFSIKPENTIIPYDEELTDTQQDMIENISEMDEIDAKDIMIHRGEIVCFDGNDKLSVALEQFKDSTHSRFPVYLDDLDNIIGIVHMRELLLYSLDKVNQAKKMKDIEGLMSPPIFVPETRGINDLFSLMQKQKSHLVLVKDEYGQTSGLVSMEDIIEEIVGDILDEHDEEEKSVIDRGNGLIIMFGHTELDEVRETLDLNIDTDEIETLNGLLINELGRIPKEGENITLTMFGYNFEIMDVKGNMIQGVKVTKVSEDTAE